MAKKWTCPVCGALMDSRGKGSHRGSVKCLVQSLETPVLGEAHFLHSSFERICSLCGELIESNQGGLAFVGSSRDEWGKLVHHIFAFHLHHLSEEDKTKVFEKYLLGTNQR